MSGDRSEKSNLGAKEGIHDVSDMHVFEQTVGWQALSIPQREFIRASLHPENRGASTWYCHSAVWALEHEMSIDSPRVELDHIGESFYDGHYSVPESIEYLRGKIDSIGFPVVIHIARQPPPLTLLQNHTFMLLGCDENGEYIGWEKEDEHGQFRRVTLSENFAKYPPRHNGKDYYWGVRSCVVTSRYI